MSNNNGTGLQPTKIIERTWEGIPGAILRFPLSIALSGKMATEREQALALGANEKAERLLDFRMRMLSDTLDAAPTLLYIDKLQAALDGKIGEAFKERGLDPTDAELTEEELEARAKERTEIRENTKLTEEEVEALTEPLPGFPEDFTPEKAYDYFSQTDGKGRKIFQFLVEDVISEFWLWATPRPTISVSAFMQDK